jgi:two-component system, LytTR family, response regulator LytT
MNVLIIENEKPAVEKLQRLIKNIDPTISVVGILESVEHSIDWLLKNDTPDLILMDIQLDDGICFEIFESVKIKSPIIFTTAYDEYAIRAFKVNSVDYLLKPITKESLASAIEKLRTLFPVQTINNEKINHIYEQLGAQHKTRFFVKIGEHCQSISTNEIACFYIVERCTFFMTSSGKRYDVNYSLEQLEKLIDPQLFFRINRHTIINISVITDIISFSTNRLKIKIANEDKVGELLVSREKVTAFKEWLDR